MTPANQQPTIAVIGGGPAGLMAAETAAAGGAQVDLYEAMPAPGRKFLIAGKGGLNLTHDEPAEQFLARYGTRRAQLTPFLESFGPDALRAWVAELGFATFVGSSRRVFPEGMKAGPLLRAWRQRLTAAGVRLHTRHRWLGWDEAGALRCATPRGELAVQPRATILALGGGSWPQTGSDAAWVPLLEARGVAIAPLRPANCGFDVGWSDHFAARHAGSPLKAVNLCFPDPQGSVFRRRGELVVTETGLEGSLIYAAAAFLREAIAAEDRANIYLDLAPDRPVEQLAARLARPRGKKSLATHLQGRAGLKGVGAALLRECLPPATFDDPARLAAAIKGLPVALVRTRPLAEAISSAGGVSFAALDERLMVRAVPGLFCAGEMLDWEAPTGGYLLTACFATGRAAGRGALAWLAEVSG